MCQDPRAFGGQAVGGFGDAIGDAIEFPQPVTSREVQFVFSNGTGRHTRCGIFANGKRAGTIEFVPTGDWHSYQTVLFRSLPKGSKILRLEIEPADFEYNQKGFCANIDALIPRRDPVSRDVGVPTPGLELTVPLGDIKPNPRTQTISCRLKLPLGVTPFRFVVTTVGGAEYKSLTFARNAHDPEWARYTLLFPDLEPVLTSESLAGGLAALKIQFDSFEQSAKLEIGIRELILAQGWPSTPPKNCPLARSTDFAGIELTPRYATYTHADTWYPSWASDGNLYSPYTDGFVSSMFVRSDNRNAITGMAKIEGDDPLKLKVTDLGFHQSRPWPFMTRYPCGTLVHNGIWYYGTYILDTLSEAGSKAFLGPFVGFRTSKDLGKTWTETPCTPLHNLFGELADRYPEDAGTADQRFSKIKMGTPHFVDFGKNMEHSPDGKAYLIAHGNTDPRSQQSWIQGDSIYLARVTPSVKNINDLRRYEFFAGHDESGKPQWTNDFSQIQPVFTWPAHAGCATATYNPGLKKYLMVVSTGLDHVSPFSTYIMEGEQLTGPWRLISYLEEFGRNAYFCNIPSKFISADGHTFWLCYAATFAKHTGNPRGSAYAMSLREMKLLSSEHK